MKRTFALLLAICFVTLCSFSADNSKAATFIMDFRDASPSIILPIYEKLSGLELVIDSHVKTMSSQITLRIEGSRSKEELRKLMREALLKQAGIVITRLDDKRESVTFNDALPITK